MLLLEYYSCRSLNASHQALHYIVFIFSVRETISLTKALLRATTSSFSRRSSTLTASSVMSSTDRAFTFLKNSSMILSPFYGWINRGKLKYIWGHPINDRASTNIHVLIPHLFLQAALFSFRSSILITSRDILKLLQLQGLFPSISDDMFGEVSQLSHVNPKALVTHTWS